MKNNPTPSTWTILGGAVAILIGSFLDFWEVSIGPISQGFNAWSGDLWFPVTIIPLLCALAMAAHVGLTTFAGTQFPDRVLGYSWNQLHLVLGAQAAVMMLAFLLQDRGGFDLGIGFWLMFLGSAALIVGAVLRARESVSPASGGGLA